jgi:hypothetical protein
MARFIPTQEMQRLTRGSYEQTISRLDEAVQETVESLFGEKIDTHVLGTFPGYALVAAEDGRCLRLKFEESASGEIHFVQKEEVEVTSYAEDDLEDFLRTESEKVIELFNQGHQTEALDRLRGLSKYSDKWDSSENAEDMVETWMHTLNRNRPWKRLYEARRDKIHRSLWDSLKSLEDSRLRPKFQRLYDGSSINEDLEGYRDLVVDDLVALHERINVLKQQVQGAYATIRVTAPRMEEAGEGETMTTFTAFSEDLLEDLSRINTISTEAPKQVSQVGLLGKLHDQLVERLFSMEVAGGFISQMATRLSAAQ